MTNDTYKTPGQLIQELLDEREWSQRVLAVVLNASETGINKIIAGKQPLDAELALQLSELFGVPAERFLELQKQFELAQARIVVRDDPSRANRAHLFANLPISEMIQRRWIDAEDVRNFAKVEKSVADFFRVNSLSEIEFFPHAAKKTNVFGEATPCQLAWLYRVKEVAEETLSARYTQSSVELAISKLKELMVSAEATRKVPRILAECGIRYVIVESLPGSKIDGVCFWLNEKTPVIGMSLRYDRIDNFWFVLRHELEHVLRRHGMTAMMLDAELEGERAGSDTNIAEEERVANQAAAEFCVPTKSLESFVARKAPFFSERDIIGFARVQKIHPGIAAGQLQRRIKRYDLFRNHLVKIKSTVTPGAMVDGWGDVAPVERTNS